jgi:hypothetical protein
MVNNVALLPKDVVPSSDLESWKKVPLSIRDGVLGKPPMYLWYQLGPSIQELQNSEKGSLITELDVLYGESAPFWGFEKLLPAINEGIEGKVDPTWLSYRRGVKGKTCFELLLATQKDSYAFAISAP